MLILKPKHFLLFPSNLQHQLFFSSELELGASPPFSLTVGKSSTKRVFSFQSFRDTLVWDISRLLKT